MNLVREKGEHNAVGFILGVDEALESARLCLLECSRHFAHHYSQNGSEQSLMSSNNCAVCAGTLEKIFGFLKAMDKDERIRVLGKKGE